MAVFENSQLGGSVDIKSLINSGYQMKANAENLKVTLRTVKNELLVKLAPVLSSEKIDSSINEMLNVFTLSSDTILRRVYGMADYISNDVASKYENLDNETASLLDDLRNTSNFDLSNHSIANSDGNYE